MNMNVTQDTHEAIQEDFHNLKRCGVALGALLFAGVLYGHSQNLQADAQEGCPYPKYTVQECADRAVESDMNSTAFQDGTSIAVILSLEMGALAAHGLLRSYRQRRPGW